MMPAKKKKETGQRGFTPRCPEQEKTISDGQL